MRDFDNELAAHLAGGATTLCWCYVVTRADGVVLGFTDHDRDVVLGALTCEAASGFTASEMESGLGFAPGNLEIAGALSSARVTAADLARGLYDGAAIEVWRVNWAAPDQRWLARHGDIGEVTRAGSAFSAEIRGLLHRLDRVTGRLFQHGCDAALGDQRCGVALDDPAFRAAALVAAVAGDRTYAVTGAEAFASGWFSRGTLIADGAAHDIRLHEASDEAVTVSLWRAPDPAIGIGAAVTLVAGCDKMFATCRDKFANAANFRGFPHMPGNEFVLGYPRRGDGSNDGGSMNG